MSLELVHALLIGSLHRNMFVPLRQHRTLFLPDQNSVLEKGSAWTVLSVNHLDAGTPPVTVESIDTALSQTQRCLRRAERAINNFQI